MSESDNHRNELFIVFSQADMRIGIEASQVSAIVKIDSLPDSRMPISKIDQMILPSTSEMIYHAPVVLIPSSPQRYRAIVIDRIEDIIPIPIRLIRPLPRIMSFTSKGALIYWGIALWQDSIIFLVDIFKLIDRMQ